MLDSVRSGRPSKLSVAGKQEAIELVKESPRSLRKVLAQGVEKFAVSIGYSTLKQWCKHSKLRWKRVRRSLKSKRNPELFATAKRHLSELKQQAKQQLIDLVYVDQSGFTLEPCVPYAWQPSGQTSEIPCSKSKRLNVLGFMSTTCAFESMVFEQTITSAVMVSCIDLFALSIQRPTTLVIDNAPIHTSAEFACTIEKWQKIGLTIFYIPPYSPELNLIEILWRKYKWMPFSAYLSFQALQDNLFHILANIGSTYSIKCGLRAEYSKHHEGHEEREVF